MTHINLRVLVVVEHLAVAVHELGRVDLHRSDSLPGQVASPVGLDFDQQEELAGVEVEVVS